jgi:hypothetical protein
MLFLIGLATPRGDREWLVSAFGAAAGIAVAALILSTASHVLPDADTFFRTTVVPGVRRTAGAAGLTRIGAAMIDLDGATLLFTSAVALLTAMLISLRPAAQASSSRPVDALKGGGSAGGRRLRSAGPQAAPVTAQIALALILLAGAGLMVRSARNLSGTDVGIGHDNILTARLDLPRSTYSADRGTALFNQLAARIRSPPGVQSVALGSCAPVSGGCNGTDLWFLPGQPRGGAADPIVGIHWVTPDYFATLGIRILAGRSPISIAAASPTR